MITKNVTLTGFVMNTNAVKRGGTYEAVGTSSPRPATVANAEAAKAAVAILKDIAAERAKNSLEASADTV
jgi:hypothetical protein